MGLIYLDSCLVIYSVENHPQMAARVQTAMVRYPADSFAISALVTLECLVKPLKADDLGMVRRYEAGFAELEILPLPDTVYRDAARLRARFNLKTPDALHLACAQHHGCAALWTNDNRLALAGHGLAVNLLQ
jgi:predicted nucleic acid-binding protein